MNSVPEHTERFSFASGRLRLEAAHLSYLIGTLMLLDPVSFALFLTLSVLAVVFVILAFERFWLMRKNSDPRS